MNNEKEKKKIDFTELVQKIEDNKIVLPDFQRGFVWTDQKKQKALIASVLTKLPIGTILLLESKADEYGCRKIGRKTPYIVTEEEKDKTVAALLDGQQRTTTLIAFFTNILHQNGVKRQDLISVTLNRRYFLKVPTFDNCNGVENFGLSKLKIEGDMAHQGYPDFLTENIIDQIYCIEEKKDNKKIIFDDVDNVSDTDLSDYCTDTNKHDGYYIIPLYYMYGLVKNINRNHKNRLMAVLNRIATKYREDIIRKLRDDNVSEKERLELLEKCFGEKNNYNEIKELYTVNSLNDEASEIYSEIFEILEKNGNSWAEDFLNYLRTCIEYMELYKIYINNSNKYRAIDIYENLNKGGKALSVFDLVMARAAKNREAQNLMEQIKNYLQEDHKKDYKKFASKCSKDHNNLFEKYILENDEKYCALMKMECYNESKSELNSAFCEMLMDMLGIINYFNDSNEKYLVTDEEKINSINSMITKRETILNIDSNKISKYIQKACIGLDRAAIFMQLRCGIRKISEVKYKLMMVLMAAVLLNDEWFYNNKPLDRLEAWYWSAILSGEFKKDQNKVFENNMRRVLKCLNNLENSNINNNCDYIVNLANGVLDDHKFADKKILLMENRDYEPEEIIKNTICQFYLAKTYKDILKPMNNYTPNRINVFTADTEEIEKHHIMPIGELNAKYKDIEKKFGGKSDKNNRDDKSCKYNSPLNFVYISKEANKNISNMSLDMYHKYCDTATLKELDIDEATWQCCDDIDKLANFLKIRYNNFKDEMTIMLRKLLDNEEIECGSNDDK